MLISLKPYHRMRYKNTHFFKKTPTPQYLPHFWRGYWGGAVGDLYLIPFASFNRC